MKTLKNLLAAAMLLAAVLTLCACRDKEPVGEEKTMSFLETSGADIIHKDTGEIFLPKGVNAGGWLVREGWMCPLKGGFLESDPDYYDRGMYETLVRRFGREEAYELESVYLDNWWTSSDFDRIAEAGFNHIRLNFSYLTFFYLPDEDGNYERRPDPFARMDWFVGECAARGLYVVLDMHGAFGSQNGRQHSGDITQSELYNSEDNMKRTEDLWVEIATHYRDNPAVFAYDLLNEPEGPYRECTEDNPRGMDDRTSDKLQWDFYDRLYKAIRAVDDRHIITVEACWEINNLPDPAEYGWKNVVYQIHIYNRGWKTAIFWGNKALLHNAFVTEYEDRLVPVYVGEWNGFSDPKEWETAFNFYESNGMGWCIWTYKTRNRGNWSLYGWGDNYDGLDADVLTDSGEVLREKFAAVKTDTDGRYALNRTLMDILKPHLSPEAGKNVSGEDGAEDAPEE